MEIFDVFESSQRFNPLFDFLFFKIFGEKGDEKQLIGFLNAVLWRTGGRSGKELIKDVEIQENKSFIKNIIDGKSCILDILAILEDGTKVNIEVQLSNKYNMERRSMFYSSKILLEGFKEGQDYRELPNVIAINIVDFDFPVHGGVHTCFRLREDTDPTNILTPALEIHFINMVKWRKQTERDIVNDPLHRWLIWLDETSPVEMVEEVVNMDNAIMAANERQDFLLQDDDERRNYWSLRMAEHDRISNLNGARREGEEIGEERGEKRTRHEIARNLLAENSSPEFVQKITGLSLEEIATISL